MLLNDFVLLFVSYRNYVLFWLQTRLARLSINQVMIGHRHDGVDNYSYPYLCARILQNGNQVFLGFPVRDLWSSWRKESSSSFTCPSGEVMIARQHVGDENFNTRYMCTSFVSRGIHVDTPQWSEDMKESNSHYVCPTNQVMTGRSHVGGEDGMTKYRCSTLRE